MASKSEVLNLCPETSLILAWLCSMFSKPKVNVLKLLTEMNSIVLSYWILLVKQGMKKSDTTSSLSDLYSCFKDKSRNVNKIKTSMNYLRNTLKGKCSRRDLNPRSLAWEANMLGRTTPQELVKTRINYNLKQLSCFRIQQVKTISIYINGKKLSFWNFIQNLISWFLIWMLKTY